MINLKIRKESIMYKRFYPFEEISRMQHRMTNIFEDFEPLIYRGPRLILEKGKSESDHPRGFEVSPYIDIKDEGGSLKVIADIPGVDKEDIKLNLNGDVLTIAAEKKKEKKEEKEGYLRKERSYRRFFRTLTLPEKVTGEGKASLKDGILEVTLPKAEVIESKTIQIE